MDGAIFALRPISAVSSDRQLSAVTTIQAIEAGGRKNRQVIVLTGDGERWAALFMQWGLSDPSDPSDLSGTELSTAHSRLRTNRPFFRLGGKSREFWLPSPRFLSPPATVLIPSPAVDWHPTMTDKRISVPLA